MENHSEQRLEAINKQAEIYYDKYEDHMVLFESSLLAKIRPGGSVTPYDVWCLGKQFEQAENYIAMCEEQGNVNLLGTLPKIAFDVITALQGQSIIPAIASVQPIDEENGTVYFKNVRAEETRGNLTAGDILVDPRQGVVTPQGYASAKVDNESNATTAATFAYSLSLAAVPMKSESLEIVMDNDATLFGRDVGPTGADKNIGTVLGAGVSGTINYTTGALDIEFDAGHDPGNNNLLASYQQNYERSTDLPQIQTYFDSRSVKAKVYALKATFGMLQSFAMKKRFGMSSEEELSRDLVIEINREIGGDLVRQLSAVAVGNTNFAVTPPASVSFFEHKQTYKDAIANAEAVLIGNAGRGTIATMVVGLSHAAIIQTLPGFQKLTDGASLGAHIFGTLDGISIIRVTESALLGANSALCMWRGPTPFEAAAVWSPYMPLAVTGTLPEAPNPLVSMKAAAVWGAAESLVPNFVTKLTLI